MMMKKNDFEFAISEEEVRGMFFDIPRRPTDRDPYDGQAYGYEDETESEFEKFENLGFSVFSF